MEIKFHHLCIEANCYEESIVFYTKYLDFIIIDETNGFHGRDHNKWIQNNSVIIELQTPKSKGSVEQKPGTIGIVHVCLKVDNLDDVINELEIKGFYDFLDNKRKYNVKDSNLSKLKAPEGTIIEFRE